MDEIKQLLDKAPQIEEQLGYVFSNKDLLAMAFTHRSFLNECKNSISYHNERLEFLGDSILNFLISDYLYAIFPEQSEGELSHMRARLVEASSCLKYIEKLEIGHLVLLGRGEKMNDGRGRNSILADLFEAIVAAIYLDGGFENAKKFLFEKFNSDIQQIIEQPKLNWKAQLQDFSQKKYQHPPTYELVEATGPDHGKLFIVAVFINHKEEGRGVGASKKEAQQAAAEDAIKRLSII